VRFMVTATTTEPITDRTRAAALNCLLCRCELKLGFEVMPSDMPVAGRVERLIVAAQRRPISPRAYEVLWFLRDKLEKHDGSATGQRAERLCCSTDQPS